MSKALTGCVPRGKLVECIEFKLFGRLNVDRESAVEVRTNGGDLLLFGSLALANKSVSYRTIFFGKEICFNDMMEIKTK